MSDPQQMAMATRRGVLVNQHVDRAEAAKTAFDAPFQALITDAAWGHVRSRDTISLRERSMLTIALPAGLGNDHELAMHIRATARTGASESNVMEALLHVAVYAGVPRANNAIKIAKDTFAAMTAGGDTPLNRRNSTCATAASIRQHCIRVTRHRSPGRRDSRC